MSRPRTVAARAFPGSEPSEQLCREVIQGLMKARRWAGRAVVELESALGTAWSDLGKIRVPDEDFDRFSACSTAYALENAFRFFGRSADRCLEVWVVLAQLRGLAEQFKKLPKTGTHG
jgi:hypothetical protein